MLPCTCMIYACLQECEAVRAGTCRDQRLLTLECLPWSLLYFLRQDHSVTLELADLKLACLEASGCTPVSHSAGVRDAHLDS